jgi:hypothetical protein
LPIPKVLAEYNEIRSNLSSSKSLNVILKMLPKKASDEVYQETIVFIDRGIYSESE